MKIQSRTYRSTRITQWNLDEGEYAPAMEPRHQKALDAVVASMHAEFGDDLAGLLLTGSVVRGEADERSDIDVYVLVDRPWRQRRTRTLA